MQKLNIAYEHLTIERRASHAIVTQRGTDKWVLITYLCVNIYASNYKRGYEFTAQNRNQKTAAITDTVTKVKSVCTAAAAPLL